MVPLIFFGTDLSQKRQTGHGRAGRAPLWRHLLSNFSPGFGSADICCSDPLTLTGTESSFVNTTMGQNARSFQEKLIPQRVLRISEGVLDVPGIFTFFGNVLPFCELFLSRSSENTRPLILRFPVAIVRGSEN